MERFSRSMLVLPDNSINVLKTKKVAIFGIGGVGSFTLETLARTGIENFVIVDNDTVSITNINRQIIATTSNIDKYKVDVARERILDINPNVIVKTYNTFVTKVMLDNSEVVCYTGNTRKQEVSNMNVEPNFGFCFCALPAARVILKIDTP